MLAKSDRLTTKEFNLVMEKGRVAHSPLFLLRYIANDDKVKVSAVAPQKFAKRAVTRNRIRRRMYVAIRSLMKSFTKKVSIVIFSKKDISKTDFHEIEQNIRMVLENARLISSGNDNK